MRRLFAAAAVAAALSLPSLAVNAQAATIAWTGAADGNWFNAANWSPAQIPSSADAVVIDSNATVSVSGATSISFATLALGDSAGNFSPTLRLSAAESASGSVTIHRGAKLQHDTNQQIILGALNVMPGGVLTHTANSSARSYIINLSVSGDFNLQAGATIAASGLGYAGGASESNGSGPGGGTYFNFTGGGGAHGGRGGQGSRGAQGGASYDSPTNPVDLGSGGGSGGYNSIGGAGGGAVLITVGNAFTLNGQISANGVVGTPGGYNYGAGSGAGGAVNITAARFSGTGSILANGAAGATGGYFGGGGGGGRIAVVVTGIDTSKLTLQADSAAGGGSGATGGGAGVIALKTTGGINYSLSIGDRAAVPQAGSGVGGATPAFSTVTLNNSIVNFDPGSNVTINSLVVAGGAELSGNNFSFGSAVPLQVRPGGSLKLTANQLTIPTGSPIEVQGGGSLAFAVGANSGGYLIVRGGGTFRQLNTQTINFDSVTVEPGGVITHAANAAVRSARLNLNVAGNFDLQAGASIAVSGAGYAGGASEENGSGPGGGTYFNFTGGGGAHGGRGGQGSRGAQGGASYDSPTNPIDLGSGGGSGGYNSTGGAGGGAVLITVGNAFSLNGQINANGAVGTPGGYNYGAGSGAGGAVNITAARFSGTGSILANGAAGATGGYFGGGGGGGRIAVVVTGTDSSRLNLQANHGTGGGAGATSGGAGVIALKTTGGINYSLSIGDLTAVPQAGSGVGGATPAFSTVTLNNSVVNFDPGSNVSINSLVVAGGAELSGNNFSFGSAVPLQVRPGGSLKVTANQLTIPTGSPIEVQGGGSLAFAVGANSGGSLIVRGGGTFRQLNTQTINFDSVTVEPGGVITHAANAAVRSARLNLNVAGNFELQAGASISVSGAGYAGGASEANGSGPGPGTYSNFTGGGGAHGGAGGKGSRGAQGGASYDSATNPIDLGSGGGSGGYNSIGGAGGGAVLITVGNAFSLNGQINANGAVGAPGGYNYGAGSGAGGAVNITAAQFSGTGSILANGAAGATGGYFGGGGGGGIVALNGCNSNLVLNGVGGGAAGGPGATAGGAGVFSPVVPPACPSAPPQPANLAVSSAGEDASGSTFITATWDPATQALSYVLRASTASNFTGEVFTETSAATTATVRGLTPAATYFLAVKAVNDIGSSNFSAVVSRLTPADLTAPQAPALTAASGRPAGAIALSWRASASGEVSAFYNVYRATSEFVSTAGITPALTRLSATTAIDLPPSDGTYFYGVTALDPSGNESALSNRLSTASIHAANAPISGLTASFVPAQKRIVLNWGAPSTGTPVSYAVYRTTFATSATAPQHLIQSLNGLTFTDQPPLALDATYFYRVTSFNPVGDESAPSNSAAAVFDTHAPVISISGVTPGQHSRFNLTPSAAIADFSAFTASIALNGQPFSAGTIVTAVGTYTFTVAAQDVFGATASAAAAFTIDKSSPMIMLAFPVSGGLLNTNATAIYSLFDDFTATGALIVRSAAGQAPPFVFSSEGLNAVSLTATDLAGNVGAAAVTFTLDKTAPAAVTDLRVGDVRVGEVDLLWTAPSDALSGVAGYLVRVATYPITAGNFLGIPAAPAGAPGAAGSLETMTVAGDTNKTLYFSVRSTDAAGNLSALSNPSLLDSDPPILSGLSPAFGASVSRPTRVSVVASDLSGVASVVFTLDGVAVATRAVAPYFFDWATLAFADGEHSVGIRATDAAGNSVVFPGRYSLHYAPPPTPSIVSPASGFSTFAATVTVTGAVEPGTTAQARVNGAPAGSAFAASGSFSVPVVLPVEGDYQLTVVAVDAKGQSGPSAARTVHYNLAPPSPPSGFSAETRAAGKVHLSWAVPGGKTPVSYRVYRSPSAAALSAGVTPGSSLRVASGLTGTEHDDMPSSDGVYYYGATSLDSSGNESGLSEVTTALSDRAVPTAAITLATGTVTVGQYLLTLTLSKPLASVPILLFVAGGAGPQAVSLSASSPTVWRGTLTVTAATAYGAAAFQFQGTDFAGNSGTGVTAGRTVFVDNRGPQGAVTLYPFSPLKAGEADLALILDEPAASTPALAFVVAGTTYPVTLEGAGTTWVATITVPSANGAAVFRYAAADALGNAGTTLSSGGSFVIDTKPTGAPLSLSAVSRPAGVVRLSWSGPIGEPAAAYRVFRDSVALPGTAAPAGDQTGRFDDTPAAGAHTYQASALDVAGNESARSNAAAALSDATPPAAPAGSTATINGFGRAEIAWSAVAGETYRVHRTTYAPSNISATPSVVVGSPPFVDTPPQNGFIYYAVEAVDGAGNVSAAASVVSVFFDRAPPVITIMGVTEGGLYNAAVFPAYSASDPALNQASVSGRLNGAPFASGAAISAEGDYTLQVTAANLAAISSTVTAHFSVDLTSPSISVSGVVGGQTYHQPVSPAVNVTDARLASVVLLLDGAPYVAGTPVIADGSHSLVVTARDLAGNVASSTTTFTLDAPPAPPPAFTVAAEEGAGAVLTWQSPAADVAGYRAYRDGTPLHQGLLAAARFSDPAFALGSARVYEVSAVDAGGQEGARARASLPAVSFALDGYGVTENGVAAFVRGFFDTVRVRAVNASGSAKLVGPAAVELLSAGAVVASGSAPSLTVAAGAQGLADGVLAVPVGLPDAASLRVTLRLPVEPGSLATVRRTFAVASRAPREPIVEVLPEPLVRGTNKNVTVKLHNQGSAPLEVLSANPSDVLVELRTTEGLVLSSARLSQTVHGAQASPSGFFVPVPAGGAVLLDPVSLFVPDALGASAQIRARVDRVFSNLVSGPVQGPRAFETVKPVSGVAEPPYRVSAAPALPLYDQDRTVIITGEAKNPSDQLMPGATVQVGVSLRGFDRVASTRTDGLGRYQITFSPAPGEAGLYTLWASHPEVVNRQPQSSFTVVGLGYRFADFAAAVTQNASVSFRVDLVNTGQTRVEGLAGAVLSSAVLAGAGLTLDAASLPSSLEAGQSASLSLTASASAAAALGRSRFTLRVTESHGFTRALPIFVDAAGALPVPSAVPQAFNVGLRAGQPRRLETRLKNLGTRDWQGVTLSAPVLSWARIDGPTSLGDIPPGGEKLVAIMLEPPASLPSQAYASNPLISVNATNAASVPLNTLITITASGEGNVAYTIIDADKPRSAFGVGVSIPGAEATLVSLDVAGLSFRAVADSNGVARVLNVPQGRYSYTVRAAGYEDRSGTENIEPGVTLTKEIVLPTNVVSYEWTVEPTTIQDKYNITLGITFKTDVPAPVVSVEPAVLNFALAGGQSADAQLTFENKGLITAKNVKVRPNITDPAVTVDFPFDTIPELRPGQKVTVPFRIGLIHASCHPLDLGIDYHYIAACGLDTEKALPPVKITAGECYNLPTTAVGGGSSGPGFTSNPQGSGGTGISLSVPSSYISFAMPQPPAPSGGAQICRSPKIKYPSECSNCDQIGGYSNPGGDPRVPESDLSLSVPKFGGSLDFTRVYDSEDLDATSLGKGWSHSFSARVSMFPVGVIYFPRRDLIGGSASMEYTGTTGALIRNDAGVGPFGIKAEDYAELRTPSGRRLLFRHAGNGQFTAPVGEPSTLVLDTATAGGYTWTLPDKTVYRFSAGGRLDTIKDRNNNTVTLGYDGSGLSTVRDPDNRVLYTFAHSGGKLLSVTDLAGRVVRFGYNGQGQLISASGPKGITGYGYSSYEIPELDADGFANGIFGAYNFVSLMTSVTSPNGHVTSFTYGPAAKTVDYAKMPLFQATQASGGGTGGFTTGDAGFGSAPTTVGRATPPADKAYFTALIPIGSSYVVDTARFAQWFFSQRLLTTGENGPLGNYTFSHTIDELIEGGRTVVTDPRGLTETRTWENLGGRTQSTNIVDAAGGVSKIAHDTNRNPAELTDRTGKLSRYTYDSRGNMTEVTNPQGRRSSFVFDSATNRLASMTDPRSQTTRFFYDANGNLIRTEDARNNALTASYGVHGLLERITYPNQKILTIGRDAYGFATSITDPLNRAAQFGYDELGRLTRITDGMNKTTQFQRDGEGNLLRMTDAVNGATRYDYVAGILTTGKLLEKLHDPKNQTTTFGYDQLGRLTTITNPLNQVRRYDYDPANHPSKVTKPDGTAITFEYDSLGRISKTDRSGDMVTYDYDAAGNRIRTEDTNSLVQFAYDADNHPSTVLQTNKSAGVTSRIDYEYDENGNRRKMTLAASPTPFVWIYGYDNLDRITALTDPAGLTYIFDYDVMGRRKSIRYPNGLEAVYGYDDVGQVISVLHRRLADSVVVASATYTYDNAGNRRTTADFAGVHTFDYDDLHRLTSVRHSHAGLLNVPEDFSYDSVGNVLQASFGGAVYNAANQIVSNDFFQYTHNANGNRTRAVENASSEQTFYSYDHNDRLTEMSRSAGAVTSYRYDVAGHRIERSSAGEIRRYIYDGTDVLAVLDGSNSILAIYTHGPQSNDILGISSGTSVLFAHKDALNSVSALSDQNGSVVERVVYKAFGEPTYVAASTSSHSSYPRNLFGFTGHIHDDGEGLIFMKARYFDHRTARFMAEDPMSFNGSLNLYSYASNNPILLSDPRGLDDSWDVFWDWFLERKTGTSTAKPYEYGPDHEITKDLMHDEGVEEAIRAWNEKGCPPDFDYRYKFSLDDYFRELFTRDGTGSFLGSYHVKIKRNPDGKIDFTVLNRTGLESGTRSPLPDKWINDASLQDMIQGSKAWHPSPKSLLNNREQSEWGPGGNFHQKYTWTK